ncbi:MAG: hypothetical protein M1834_001167 [Cirrosporium novae-zelandiae]|nr:MAG: hypothetical protein M1834_001167 [Cirrosporium novae-zelandiae]
MPSSSLFLGVGTLLFSSLMNHTAASPLKRSACEYELEETWQGEGFFDNFDFYTGQDPTSGFVDYQCESDAQDAGLISADSSSVYMGVEHGSDSNDLDTDGPGRKSVRIESKEKWTHGLFIADIAHMPGAACGVWPAFWTLGDGTWPAGGEIDIIEGVNHQTTNLMNLHTSDTCTVAGADESGTLLDNDCSVSHSTSGCGVTASGGSGYSAAQTYGDGFNDADGGVYALEWTSDFIKLWFWTRSQIPSSILAGEPDVTTFGTPQANYQGSCDIDSHFSQHKIIFDTTFCGDYAGNVFTSQGCPASYNDDGTAMSSMDSCKAYVANNAEEYENAYWEVNSIKIYKEKVSASSTGSAVSSTSTSSLSSVTPVASTGTLPITTISVAMGRSDTSALGSSTMSSATGSGMNILSFSMTFCIECISTADLIIASMSGMSGSRTGTMTMSAGSSMITGGMSITSAPSSMMTGSAAMTSKQTTTTVITTSYVDVCPEGFTTVMVTQTVTYCPAEQTSSGAPPPGFTTKVTVCNNCYATPTTVTLTVPTSVAPAMTTAAVTTYGYSTSTIYATSVVTVTSCAPTITNCPAESIATSTMIVPITTTICPITAMMTGVPSMPASSMSSIMGSSAAPVVVMSSVSVMPVAMTSSMMNSMMGSTMSSSMATPISTPAPYSGNSAGGYVQGGPSYGKSNMTMPAYTAASTGFMMSSSKTSMPGSTSTGFQMATTNAAGSNKAVSGFALITCAIFVGLLL